MDRVDKITPILCNLWTQCALDTRCGHMYILTSNQELKEFFEPPFPFSCAIPVETMDTMDIMDSFFSVLYSL